MNQTTRNRLKLLGIAALSALPVVASYALYWFWEPSSHSNYGALVTARPLPAVQGRLTDGATFDLTQVRGRWVMLSLDSGACEAACRQKLWVMRQVRRAQGKEMDRVERVWIVDDARPVDTELAREHGGLWIAGADASALIASLAPDGVARDHIWLVDPLGNVMMRFPTDVEPRGMLKDLKRLLKYSRIGQMLEFRDRNT